MEKVRFNRWLGKGLQDIGTQGKSRGIRVGWMGKKKGGVDWGGCKLKA